MPMITSQITEYAIVAIAAIVLIVIAVAVARRLRTAALQRRYGSEYDRTLNIAGSRTAAERELHKREKRVRTMHIEELPNSARFRYVAEWRAVQGGFVDEPRVAVERADGLVATVMRERGYASETFDQRVEDLSPTYPHVVQPYIEARDVAQRARNEGVTTEDLRQAMVRYRTIFDELVGQPHRTAS
jgi:hypothetical protein